MPPCSGVQKQPVLKLRTHPGYNVHGAGTGTGALEHQPTPPDTSVWQHVCQLHQPGAQRPAGAIRGDGPAVQTGTLCGWRAISPAGVDQRLQGRVINRKLQKDVRIPAVVRFTSRQQQAHGQRRQGQQAPAHDHTVRSSARISCRATRGSGRPARARRPTGTSSSSSATKRDRDSDICSSIRRQAAAPRRERAQPNTVHESAACRILVGRDAGHCLLDGTVAGNRGLVGGDQRGEGLSHATLDRIVGGDLFQFTQPPGRRGR